MYICIYVSACADAGAVDAMCVNVGSGVRAKVCVRECVCVSQYKQTTCRKYMRSKTTVCREAVSPGLSLFLFALTKTSVKGERDKKKFFL
ncbi:hypothetical protein B0I35DRAFT_203632 [Stachybotrys elegans]|uniref:Uncharacterized protein n=1 Tax=Stachybotrys elegans TaxID=80388 RepID=A0A8K0SQ24_9HYPO|nr:hypothetical protein B0I35DRAFT_203632 [Stachybotrys elegans]